MHIGDNLVTDVAGAKSAGLVAVWLNRQKVQPPNDSVEPDLTIGSLRELLSAVCEVLSGSSAD